MVLVDVIGVDPAVARVGWAKNNFNVPLNPSIVAAARAIRLKSNAGDIWGCWPGRHGAGPGRRGHGNYQPDREFQLSSPATRTRSSPASGRANMPSAGLGCLQQVDAASDLDEVVAALR